MGRLRTFIGVDIGKTIRDRAIALQEKLAQSANGVKWVEPEHLHVTMLFLGEVDDREVAAVCRAVADETAGHVTFEMTVEKLGCFPNPRRPRVLWIGVGQGAEELRALHDGLEGPLMKLGCYRREERQYTPHITLGRVKIDRPPDSLGAALVQNANWQGGNVVVQQLLVMSSELTSQGPNYTVLSRAKLQ
ncbi:MAG TPA: RNA 2',3'-cyclic phosphodiesterase [Gemmataceae bacterium]|nr:RNA 2',3'-cyclic phosphodiesterase [Gemmataceae bacterium]